MKFCPRCRQTLSLDNFYKANSKGYIPTYCRPCFGEVSSARHRKFKSTPGDVVMEKECCGCKNTLPASDFSLATGRPGGLRSRCRECTALQGRAKRYGMTEDSVKSLSSICAICSIEGKMYIDHDHDTGVVRGMLCMPCNLFLGLVHDSNAVIQKLIDYLTEDV